MTRTSGFHTCILASVFLSAACAYGGDIPPVQPFPVSMPQVKVRQDAREHAHVAHSVGYPRDCGGLHVDVRDDGLLHFKVDFTVLDVDRVFTFLRIDMGQVKLALYPWRWRGEHRQPYSIDVDLDVYNLEKSDGYHTGSHYFHPKEGKTYTLEVLKNSSFLCVQVLYELESGITCHSLSGTGTSFVPLAGQYGVEVPVNPTVEVDCGSLKLLPGDQLTDLPDHSEHPSYPGDHQPGIPVFAHVEHPSEVRHAPLQVKTDGNFRFKVKARVKTLYPKIGEVAPFLWVNFPKVGLDVYPIAPRGLGRVPGGFEVELDTFSLFGATQSGHWAGHYFPLQEGAVYDLEVSKNSTGMCVIVNITGYDPACSTDLEDVTSLPKAGFYTVWFPKGTGVQVISGSFQSL